MLEISTQRSSTGIGGSIARPNSLFVQAVGARVLGGGGIDARHNSLPTSVDQSQIEQGPLTELSDETAHLVEMMKGNIEGYVQPCDIGVYVCAWCIRSFFNFPAPIYACARACVCVCVCGGGRGGGGGFDLFEACHRMEFA